MGKTGKYFWDGTQLVKYSDDIPKLGYVTECSVGQLKGQQHHTFTCDHIDGKPTEYRDRRQLYTAMKRNKLSQAEPVKQFQPQHKPIDVKKIEKHVIEHVSRRMS